MKGIEILLIILGLMFFLKKNNLEFMDMDDDMDDDMDMNNEDEMENDKFAKIDNKINKASNKKSDIDFSNDGQNISGVNSSKKGKVHHSAPKSKPVEKVSENKKKDENAGGLNNMTLYIIIGIVIFLNIKK